jgi:hypothetical protein
MSLVEERVEGCVYPMLASWAGVFWPPPVVMLLVNIVTPPLSPWTPPAPAAPAAVTGGQCVC